MPAPSATVVISPAARPAASRAASNASQRYSPTARERSSSLAFLLSLVQTSDDYIPALARLTLGLVILPHGMQKMFGWFGGGGFSGTMNFFTGTMHIPYVFALLAITAEFFGGLGLITGFFGRIAAFGVSCVMIVAVVTTHLANGFFMNWFGNQKGEGFEYHLLALGLAAIVMLKGSGAFSLDRLLAIPLATNPTAPRTEYRTGVPTLDSAMPPARTRLITAFAIVYVVWGSTYLAIHYAIATIPPFLMAGIRFVTAGSIIYLWTMSRRAERPTRLHWRNAAIIGVLLLAGGNGGVVWAEQTVPTGITALLVATVPLWLVVLEWTRPNGKRPSTGVAIGLIIGLAGMGVLVGPESFHGAGPVNLWGAGVLIFASFLWAVGSLFARGAELPSKLLTSGMEMLAGGGALILFSIGTGEAHHFNLHAVSTSSILGLAYLITFGSLIAFTAYSWILKNASPAAVGTYAYVNPVVAVFLGWLIAGESVTSRTLAGAAIIVAAVGIVTFTSNRGGEAT
ncbi:MAG: EamA family transporter [Gemmatimonadaceae bacterium]